MEWIILIISVIVIIISLNTFITNITNKKETYYYVSFLLKNAKQCYNKNR